MRYRTAETNNHTHALFMMCHHLLPSGKVVIRKLDEE